MLPSYVTTAAPSVLTESAALRWLGWHVGRRAELRSRIPSQKAGKCYIYQDTDLFRLTRELHAAGELPTADLGEAIAEWNALTNPVPKVALESDILASFDLPPSRVLWLRKLCPGQTAAGQRMYLRADIEKIREALDQDPNYIAPDLRAPYPIPQN